MASAAMTIFSAGLGRFPMNSKEVTAMMYWMAEPMGHPTFFMAATVPIGTCLGAGMELM